MRCRRIYDISCALEGIGLIEKCAGKNFVRVRRNSNCPPLRHEPRLTRCGGAQLAGSTAGDDEGELEPQKPLPVLSETQLAELREEIAECKEQARARPCRPPLATTRANHRSCVPAPRR